MQVSQADIYYQAMLARDYRFDGKFFVGVKTTGIYCRPICPARPKRENVTFFEYALAAENAGFRPCLRCHPEAAPGQLAWSGGSQLIQRALQLLSSEAGPGLQESDFACLLGVSARHLRRVFQAEFGQTPKQIAQTSRLNFARQLVLETQLPLITVAMTAGFGSLRRFNSAFLERFGRSPSQLRRQQPEAHTDLLNLSLAYRPPFDWAGLLGYFKRHQLGPFEQISDTRYQRVFQLAETVGWLELSDQPERACLRLKLFCPDPRLLAQIVKRLRRMCDLDSDPLLVANVFAEQPALAALWQAFPGLRVPGAWDSFEAAVAIVLGQMVSLQQARQLNAELVANHGRLVCHPLSGQPIKLFPQAADLAGLTDLQLKTTARRRQTLLLLARALLAGEISLAAAQEPQHFRKQLLALPGIGPWSAEMLALRVLGDPNAFPDSDLLLKKQLAVQALDLQALQPWRAYAALALWAQSIHKLTLI